MDRQKGQVLVMTIVIMAIGCIWFALVLAVSGNYFRVSHDEITLVQSRALAQGAMEEALAILEQAVDEDTLAALPERLLERPIDAGGLEGMLKASWRQTAEREMTITASGQTKQGKSTVSGELYLAKLPQEAGSEQPILLVKSDKAKTLLADNGYDHLLKDDHAGGVLLDQPGSLSGGLYCIADGQKDWTATVRSLDLEGPLYVEGHLWRDRTLKAKRLWVTGDLYIAEGGSLDCPEIWVGGETSGNLPDEAESMIGAPIFKNVLVIRQMRY